MASTQGREPSLMEKLLLLPHFGKVILSAVLSLCTSPFTGGAGANTLLKNVVFAALRTHFENISTSQEGYIKGTTEKVYLDVAKKAMFQPDTDVLASGMKVHWLGTKSADKIILYLHGGGYVVPATPAHVQWCYDLGKALSEKQGRSVSCVFPSYTLAPEAQYPTQLVQAIECVDMLVNKMGKKPSNIIIAGDSAGGNLTLAVLSHLLHPHSEVPELKLSEPFAGAVLLSPWTKFTTGDASFKRNQSSDYITPGVASGKKYDNYNMADLTEPSWFKGLDKVAKDIFVWGGGGEILIDSINATAEKLKKAHPRVEYVVQPGASHEDFIIDTLLGYKDAQGTKVVRSWMEQRL